MATIVTKHGEIEIPDTDPRIQAYRALYKAAERMGWGNYQAQYQQHRRARRSDKTFRFHVTDEHRAITEAMPAVLDGRLTPDEAMAMLHDYDVMQQRLGKGVA